MHDSLHISAYTPSNTDPAILEQIFVQRHRLLEKTVAWCTESITTDKKNHLIFVGPRGSGKTHFISMVVNQLRAIDEIQKKMLIVWLGEDHVITSLLDLVLAILENLVQIDPKQFNKDCLQQAKGQEPDTAVEIILHSITEQLKTRTILLVKENMSDVFNGLKDGGQKKLRAYLQEKNNVAILASSQQLFSGISSRDAAFFGFFDTYHLSVLGVEDAKQLISNIAALNNNQPLVDFLKTPQGCYRVRALHHLAGGNHRLYVELVAFLTVESLDNFVSAITKLADNLTPYFQEKVKSLPPQQGKIVQKLCELQGATPVKKIAEESFIGERSTAKQLGVLAKKGYVISHKRGKQSYYEMAEPLMRLCLEAKSSHGKPLKLVASLLRIWFSDAELQVEQDKDNKLSADYKVAALSMDKNILIEINNLITEKIVASIASNNYEKIIAESSEIINAPETDGLPFTQKQNAFSYRGFANFQKGDLEQAYQDWDAVIDTPGTPDEIKIFPLLSRSIALGQNGEIEQEIQDLTAVIRMIDVSAEHKALALLLRSIAFAQRGEKEKVQLDLTTVITMPNISAKSKAKAFINRSIIYSQNGQIEKQLQDLMAVINMSDAPKDIATNALFIIPEVYYNLLETEKAQQALNEAFKKGEKTWEYYPSNTHDILQAMSQIGSSFWQKQIIWILDIYAKYKALDSLGGALVSSISFFTKDELLISSFKKWQQLWKQHGGKYQQIELPLQILNAAVLSVEQNNDKPLLSLPKEVRELVLPLFDQLVINPNN